MEQERWSDRLSKYIIYTVVAAVVCAICWYFKDVIVYILVAGVLALVGSPLTDALNRIRIGRHSMPTWLSAIISIFLIIAVFFGIVTLIFPIVMNVVKDISMVNMESTVRSISVPLQTVNDFLTEKFPSLGSDFRIEKFTVQQMQQIFDLSMVSSVLSSVTSFLTSFGIGLFSVIFIAFFFFKDSGLFTRIITSLVPDEYEKKAVASMGDIKNLLTRYFLGLLIEVCGVALLNFLGLMFVAKMGFNASIGIAFITGVLNIIPYVGPLFGGFIGTVLAVVMKYICATSMGLEVNFWVFIIILVAIFWVTQLVDNFFFQPVIYSNSIKAHPLEIFVVLLMAGYIGGILGMLIAIPSYTVIRVIAGRFFRNVKFIRVLIPEEEPVENPIKRLKFKKKSSKK